MRFDIWHALQPDIYHRLDAKIANNIDEFTLIECLMVKNNEKFNAELVIVRGIIVGSIIYPDVHPRSSDSD